MDPRGHTFLNAPRTPSIRVRFALETGVRAGYEAIDLDAEGKD